MRSINHAVSIRMKQQKEDESRRKISTEIFNNGNMIIFRVKTICLITYKCAMGDRLRVKT